MIILITISNGKVFGALKCSHCQRELKEDEPIYIKVKGNDLHGYTHLSGWADQQYKLCEACAKQLK